MGIMLQVILGMFQFLLLTRIPTSHAKVCMYGSFDLLYIYISIYIPGLLEPGGKL